MNVGTIVKWAAIIIGAYFVLRLVSNIGGAAASSLQETYNPSVYPYQYGGGVIYLGPGYVSENYRPAYWGGGNSGMKYFNGSTGNKRPKVFSGGKVAA